MTFPITNWQFWLVTLLALAALLWMLRVLLPIPFLGRKLRDKRKGRSRVDLTIGGRDADKPRK